MAETPKPEEGGLKERETYTAKQVATRIGTDAKTLRKFFRSSSSTVEPVGQGGRYEFDAALLPKIRKEFESWNKPKPARAPAAPKAPVRQPVEAQDLEEDLEEIDLDELEDEEDDDEEED